ncbi:hypothetical protein MOTC310_17005 [Methylobacterium oryzae]|jgi:predicted amidophosphoribosyltransferase|uniref:Zinc ribbon domain-containing protein n=1 Tax=Methylobacterium oryzae TaxID=334852 RepID=A0ABU7TQZ4_9HYPH
MLLSKCHRCGRPVSLDASRCPTCLAAIGPEPQPSPQDETGYRIAMLAVACAILVYLVLIRR